jgi:hypothetical protein
MGLFVPHFIRHLIFDGLWLAVRASLDRGRIFV